MAFYHPRMDLLSVLLSTIKNSPNPYVVETLPYGKKRTRKYKQPNLKCWLFSGIYRTYRENEIASIRKLKNTPEQWNDL